jgi:UDP:flavonoid glycosyltransferase YjiC (YdhE family)
MRILAAMFQGGGNIPLLLPIMARLVERGHKVRIIAGPGIRRSRLPVSAHLIEGITQSGASLVPFRELNAPPVGGNPPITGIIGNWVPTPFTGIPSEAQTALWAPAWADNVVGALQDGQADLLVADFYLLGALVAAEAAGIPSVALMHTVSIGPVPGVPPYGTGWLPARTPVGHLRDALGRIALRRLHRRNSLPALNAVRAGFGLRPLWSTFEQYDRASRVLMLVSSSFDFPGRFSANTVHIGTPNAGADMVGWTSPWTPEKERPLVLIALSTLNQGQEALLQNILRGIADLRIRALVTLGPSLNPARFAAPPNAVVIPFAPHAAVLPHVDAVVTQCGLGTLTKALLHGVPIVCLPLVGDQPDNAARVVARGAGIRLERNALPVEIARAIEQVLENQSFRIAARRLGAELSTEGDAVQKAVTAVEEISP